MDVFKENGQDTRIVQIELELINNSLPNECKFFSLSLSWLVRVRKASPIFSLRTRKRTRERRKKLLRKGRILVIFGEQHSFLSFFRSSCLASFLFHLTSFLRVEWMEVWMKVGFMNFLENFPIFPASYLSLINSSPNTKLARISMIKV